MAELPDLASPSPETAALTAERRDRLRRAVERLPLAWRQVVVLRLEGLGDREIAELSGLSANNVAVRLTRARVRLRELLAERRAPGLPPVKEGTP